MDFTQCEVDEWRFQHLDFPLAMNGAVAIVAAPVAAGWQAAAKIFLGIGTFISAKQATEVVTGEKTSLLDLLPGRTVRIEKYEQCGQMMTCDRMWDGVSAGSGLFLSFTGSAAMSRQSNSGMLFTNDRAERAGTWLEGQLSREVEVIWPSNLDEQGNFSTYANPLPRVRLKPRFDYREVFFEAHPELRGKVVVHHSVEQQILKVYPNLFTEAEIHSLGNLRGIPKVRNAELHLSKIRVAWNDFYKAHPNPSRSDVLDFATTLDAKYGARFKPPR